jgi:hypothetical protein
MGLALNIGASSSAYVLADRSIWLNFKNRADLAVLAEGDKRWFNPYGVMLVSGAKHPQVKTAEGQQFVDWVTGSAGQAVITSYKIGGEQFFSERGEVGWFGSTGKFRPTTVDRYHYVNYCCAALWRSLHNAAYAEIATMRRCRRLAAPTPMVVTHGCRLLLRIVTATARTA